MTVFKYIWSKKRSVTQTHGAVEKGTGFKVIAGQGAIIDMTTSSSKLIFGIFAVLGEFGRKPIRERIIVGLLINSLYVVYNANITG